MCVTNDLFSQVLQLAFSIDRNKAAACNYRECGINVESL